MSRVCGAVEAVAKEQTGNKLAKFVQAEVREHSGNIPTVRLAPLRLNREVNRRLFLSEVFEA